MKQNSRWLLTILLLLLLAFGAVAQKSKTQKPAKKTPPQKTKVQQPVKKNPVQKPKAEAPKKLETPDANVTEDEKKVRDIVAFLEYVLNTLGSSSTAARDKDVLITESYT